MKLKLALVLPVRAAGFAVIVVSGAIISTVHAKVGGVAHGDDEDVDAGLQRDAGDAPGGGAGGGPGAAGAVEPGDLVDGDVVGGRAGQGERAAVGEIGGGGGGHGDGDGGRGEIGG